MNPLVQSTRCAYLSQWRLVQHGPSGNLTWKQLSTMERFWTLVISNRSGISNTHHTLIVYGSSTNHYMVQSRWRGAGNNISTPQSLSSTSSPVLQTVRSTSSVMRAAHSFYTYTLTTHLFSATAWIFWLWLNSKLSSIPNTASSGTRSPPYISVSYSTSSQLTKVSHNPNTSITSSRSLEWWTSHLPNPPSLHAPSLSQDLPRKPRLRLTYLIKLKHAMFLNNISSGAWRWGDVRVT